MKKKKYIDPINDPVGTFKNIIIILIGLGVLYVVLQATIIILKIADFIIENPFVSGVIFVITLLVIFFALGYWKDYKEKEMGGRVS